MTPKLDHRAGRESDLLNTSIIYYNFRERKNSQVMKDRENLHFKTYKEGVNCWWLKPRLWLVDLNYNFECDWVIELSDNKLSENTNCPIKKVSDYNLASELVANRCFYKSITIEQIVTFLIRFRCFRFFFIDLHYLQKLEL